MELQKSTPGTGTVKVSLLPDESECDAVVEFEMCVSLRRQLFRGVPSTASGAAKPMLVLANSTLWAVRNDGICAKWNVRKNALMSTHSLAPNLSTEGDKQDEHQEDEQEKNS